MPADKPKIIIKKYANRRLYHTGTSAYVTLDDLAAMVQNGEDFVVQDARTGEDLTRGVLAQIIFDAESRGEGLLPIEFLRQLITFYGGHMQTLVPTYLEHALASFARDQETLSKQLNEALGNRVFDVMEDEVRRNMDMFQRSMRMFLPPTPEGERRDGERGNGARGNGERRTDDAEASASRLAEDVAHLRSELQRMQERVDKLSTAGETSSSRPSAGGGDANDPPQGNTD